MLTVSGLEGSGVEQLWEAVLDHRAAIDLDAKRSEQELRWMWKLVEDRLRARFRHDPGVMEALPALEAAVRAGSMPPTRAASALLRTFFGDG